MDVNKVNDSIMSSMAKDKLGWSTLPLLLLRYHFYKVSSLDNRLFSIFPFSGKRECFLCRIVISSLCLIVV